MCEFKALHTDREQGHEPVCLNEFYTFYEVQNLRWTQVRKEEEENGRERESTGKSVDMKKEKVRGNFFPLLGY